MRHKKQRHESSQPTISSYLSPADTDVEYPMRNASQLSPTTPRKDPPIVIPCVQSSLLNVGMRVRKAILEGYKTKSGSKYRSSTELQNPGCAIIKPENTSEHTHIEKLAQKASTHSWSWPEIAHRELTPFCGQQKIGDHTQRLISDTDLTVEQSRAESEEIVECPFLSSQGSTISSSTECNSAKGRKRRLSDDDSHSLWSYTPYSEFLQNESNDHSTTASQVNKGLENDHVWIQSKTYDNDFDDADFLDYDALEGIEVDMYK